MSNQPKSFAAWIAAEGSYELTPHDAQQESYYQTMSKLFNTVKDFIVNGIKEALSFMGKIIEKITPLLVNLSSSVINMVISLYQLVGTATTTFQKSLIAINLTGAFTAFITNIGTMLKQCDLPWSFQCAKEVVESIVNDIMGYFCSKVETEGPKANDLNTSAWIKIGIATITTVLIAGLGFTKTVSWKDLLTGTSLVGRMRECVKTVTSVADYILEEICGVSADVDKPVIDQLEALITEGSRLQGYPAAHFISHPDDHDALRKFTERIVKVTSQPISREASSRYHTTRQLLVQMYKVLYDKLTTVNVILDTKQRQAAVGLVLSGEPGVGKSELCKYLSKEIGSIMGYRSAIYTLNKKSDGFYEPYGGQSFAIYNEWMATMSEDPLLKDMNLIFSTDPMNLEGAALDCKNQPCKIKLGFLTANVDNPDFSRVLNAGACKAVWDRLYHVKVKDPLCKGRGQPNPHRKPDFSHLSFDLLHHKDAMNCVNMGPITMKTLINRLVGRCATAELDYIRNVLADDDCPEDVRSSLRTRAEALRSLLALNNPYDVIPATSNSDGWGREFFVYRFQGLTGSGKSTLCQQLAGEFSSIFNYKFQRSCSVQEFIPNKYHPMIYILDDWVERPGDQQEVLERMNQTHEKSVFVICSNTTYKRMKQPWTLGELAEVMYAWSTGTHRVQPTDCRQWKGPEGLLRRIGLQGTVITPSGDPVSIDESFSRCYTFGPNFTIRDHYGALETRESIMNSMFNAYRRYLAKPGNLIIQHTQPAIITEPSVKIVAETYADVITVLKSKTQMMKAYLGKHPKVQFFISDALMKGGAQVSLDMWNVPEDTLDSEDSVKDIFSRMCTLYSRCAPEHALEIRITAYNRIFYYNNHIGYIYSEGDVENSCPIEAFDGYLLYHRSSTDIRKITVDDYHAFKVYRQFVGSYRDLSLGEILQIDRWVGAEIANPRSISKFKIAYVKAINRLNREHSQVYKELQMKYRMHPVFWVACALFTLVGSGYLITKLVGLVADTPKVNSNTWEHTKNPIAPKVSVRRANTWDADRKPIAPKIAIRRNELANTWDGTRRQCELITKVRRNATPENLQKKDDVSQFIKEAESIFPNGFSVDEKRDYEKEVRDYLAQANDSSFETTLFTKAYNREGENNVKYLVSNSRNNDPISRPKTKLGERLYANMLQEDDMIQQSQTAVEVFQGSCNKLYYRVINKSGGTCYGIALAGKLILTVAHMAESVGEKCTIQSMGIQYEARIVLIMRDRDLAVVQVIDKTFPAVPVTKHRFHDSDMLSKGLYGYFVRCGPECQVAGGYMSFHHKTTYPITDKDNPNFRLSDKLIVFSMIGCHKIRDLVKRGDCGFPLVCADNTGTFKIIGIHNAYADMEKVYFSSFTSADWDDVVTKSLKACSNYETHDVRLESVTIDGVEGEYMLPRPYCEAFEDVQEDYHYQHLSDRLNMLGYSRKLALPSRPVSKDKFLDLPQMKIPNLKLPAAVDLTYVTDTSSLITDSYGKPDPLFTQCVKYDNRVGYSYDPDTLTLAAERVMEDMHARYGDCRWIRMHEVINGIAGEALAPFDPKTSAGPLMKMLYNVHNKMPLLAAGENPGARILLLNDSEPAKVVRSHYTQYCEILENGGPSPLIVSKDCAKVELLNAEKAAAGKVRLFNEVDLSINMVLKRYFGDLQNKVMLAHNENPIKMGQNPYKTATRIYKDFERVDGSVVSTDFSGFDKQIPAVLILIFCRAAAHLYSAKSGMPLEKVVELYDKLALSLTNAVHTCHGHLYIVDRGNESGTFVTTIMNSTAVRTLTMYTVIKQWMIIFRFTPTLAEMLEEYEEVIFGDDRAIKTSKALPITQQQLIEDSAQFGLKCTPAKTTGYIDFCSRSFEWDEVSQVCFPALKTESVLTQLRWYKTIDQQQVVDNIDNCLFEAALHTDEKVFELALHDAGVILDHLHIPRTRVQFLSRKLIRQRFVAYVMDLEEYSWLTHQLEREGQRNSEYIESVEAYKRALNLRAEKRKDRSTDNIVIDVETINSDLRRKLNEESVLMTNPDSNPVSAVLEALAACRIAERPVEAYDKNDNGDFVAVVQLLGREATATGGTKKEAKRLAYRGLYSELKGDFDQKSNSARPVVLQARLDAESVSKDYLYQSIKRHLEFANEVARIKRCPVTVLSSHSRGDGDFNVEAGIRYWRSKSGEIIVASETSEHFGWKRMRAIYLAQPGTTEQGGKILVGCDDTTSNMDGNVHTTPNLIQDTNVNPGLATIPRGMQNVVPVTETMPATLPTAPPVMGAFEPLMPVMNLNPSGPPNMLSAGAIAFDLKDLAYNQFMDCDALKFYGGDSTVKDGQVVFQIPYDPLNEFMNPYAKAYVRLHERFAGDLEYRFTVVANQTFSGFLGLCWYPHKFEGTEMLVSEAQKYNFVAESINQPFSVRFTLSDARQNQFWRKVADNKDVSERPHLICFVIMQTQSPLMEHPIVRIRIASRLCENFQVSNPVLATKPQTTAAGLATTSYKRLLGQPLVPNITRPYFPGTTAFRIVIDGNLFSPECVTRNSDYTVSDWHLDAGFPICDVDEACGFSGDRVAYIRNDAPGKYHYGVVVDASRAPTGLSKAQTGGMSYIAQIVAQALRDSKVVNTIHRQIASRLHADMTVAFNNIPDNIILTDGTEKQQIKPDEYLTAMLQFEDGVVLITTFGYNATSNINKDLLYRFEGYQFTQIQSILYDVTPDAMPSGWRHVAVTPDLPYVSVESLVSSYMSNHVSLISLAPIFSANVAPTQCVQITISDYESAQEITTLRWFPDRKSLVMNVGTQDLLYATSLRKCDRMYVSDMQIVERTNEFPITQLQGSFADNAIHPEILRARRNFQ